jgi:hypothetical protein
MFESVRACEKSIINYKPKGLITKQVRSILKGKAKSQLTTSKNPCARQANEINFMQLSGGTMKRRGSSE